MMMVDLLVVESNHFEEVLHANGKGLTPSASTPVLPAKNGGGRPGSKAYELHVTESVHAKFDGKEVREFQALGELRAVQVGGFGAAHSFSLSLEKAEHVIDLQLNDKLLQATDGAYTARLPALEKPTPLPLLNATAGAIARVVEQPDRGGVGLGVEPLSQDENIQGCAPPGSLVSYWDRSADIGGCDVGDELVGIECGDGSVGDGGRPL